MSKELGDKLRKIRKKKGLTQMQVAQELHLDRSTYAYYERGTTEPSLATVSRLAAVFSVQVEDLLPDTDSKRLAKVSDVTRGRFNVLTKEEEAMLALYRGLTPVQKENLIDLINKKKDKE